MSKRNTVKQKKMMLHNIECFYGNIRKACTASGITTMTHYRWAKEDDEYSKSVECLKDIGYRSLKERLIEAAMAKIDKGDTALLGKMLGLFLKDLCEDMKAVSRANKPQTVAVMKYVESREEAQAIMAKQREERRQREEGDLLHYL
jgi:hypothetical protein